MKLIKNSSLASLLLIPALSFANDLLARVN